MDEITIETMKSAPVRVVAESTKCSSSSASDLFDGMTASQKIEDLELRITTFQAKVQAVSAKAEKTDDGLQEKLVAMESTPQFLRKGTLQQSMEGVATKEDLEELHIELQAKDAAAAKVQEEFEGLW